MTITDDNLAVRKAIDGFRERLLKKVEELDQIEKEISGLHLALGGLAGALADKAEREKLQSELKSLRRQPTGLTDSIREALKHFKDGATAAELKAFLESSGFDLSEYAQPLSAVHVVLKRLRENKAKEVVICGHRDSKVLVFKLNKK